VSIGAAEKKYASDHPAYLKKVGISAMFNSIASALATAILLPLTIKAAGLESYGYWAVLTIFVGIGSALDFGVWKSLVFLIPRAQFSTSQLLSSSLIVCIGAGTIFAIILGILLILGLPVFGAAINRQGDLAWWLGICGCVIVLSNLMTNLVRGVLEASYRGHWVNVGYGLLTVSLYGVAVIVAQYTHDVRALIVGSATVYLVNLLAHIALLVPDSLKWESPRRQPLLSIVRYGAASFVADAPSIILGPAILYLFLLVAQNSGQYGAFDIALRIATLAATTLSMLSAPFFTIVSSSHNGGTREVRTLIARHLRVTSGLAACGWLAFWILGRSLLALVFPEDSGAIYRAALIMLFGTAAVAALEPITRMLMGIGRLRILSAIRFAMLLAALLLTVGLAHLAPLDRFSIACTVGFIVAAVGLLAVNKSERWGTS